MDFAPVYLVQRFFYYIGSFFRHWYFDGARAISNNLMLTFETADQSFAIKITLRHFSEPLYKDYSIIGRIVGVVFRTGRIVLGGLAYLVIIIAFAVIYLVWFAIPAALLFAALVSGVRL